MEPTDPPDDDPVVERLRALYGTGALDEPAGVLHVAAVGRDPAGTQTVLKINEATPRSLNDRFALDLARARADVIVTTGAILRAEPRLRYELGSEQAQDLHTWRLGQLGRPEPPLVVVLTGREDIDPDHPTLHGWATPWIFTSVDSAHSLLSRLPKHVGLAGVPTPSLSAVIDWARRRFDARTITIEAGPSTTRALYRHHRDVIDELMLSVFEGVVPAQAQGAPFVSQDELERTFARRYEGPPVVEQSGPWRFIRYLRAG